MTVVSSGSLVNSDGLTLLSLAAISGRAQCVVNCFDAGNQAAQRNYDGQHALQLALMCVAMKVPICAHFLDQCCACFDM